jgi:sulfur-oxidizing protein SoxZ
MSSQSPQPKPRIRLDKKDVKKGDVIEVKSLVSHVMESGQRRDASGKVIPRKIINKFTAELNGKTIFAADIEPAVSANPYMQFKFKAQESGTIRFTWTDDDGTKITAEEKITVT